MKKNACVAWSGGLKEGTGTVSTGASMLHDAPYGFRTRFSRLEECPGTNSEELLGAARDGCYSMALAAGLEQAGFTATRIETRAVVTLDKQGDGFAKTPVDLSSRAKVPGLDAATFEPIAKVTKQGCPVSKVLKANITLDAKLES